ncbi:hypothetical protein HS088_TW04G01417 [Tripterygium wilfordii]|uniref:Uncharacterized protein n=1 Tax=Tripterygium wilfordii TaxID=458696 RepID=A0A7J7DSV7_TRIWF|nr:hypothetical protein HS088_TW04G01417 [Tripterygium wilfordii]
MRRLLLVTDATSLPVHELSRFFIHRANTRRATVLVLVDRTGYRLHLASSQLSHRSLVCRHQRSMANTGDFVLGILRHDWLGDAVIGILRLGDAVVGILRHDWRCLWLKK